MKIAIMGAGSVGCYFGALLARSGEQVVFIARGAHLEAMRTQGLSVEGQRGSSSVSPVMATDDPASVGPVDVVLLCVKLYDTESATRAIAPLLAGGGVCISLQNGVDAQDRIGALIGAERVMGGLAYVSGVIEAPGRIRYTSPMSSLRFGEADGSSSRRAIAFRDACQRAGFEAVLSEDIRRTQWEKFVGLCTNAALTSLIRLPVGGIYHDPGLLPIARAAFEEVAAVGRAKGIALAAETAQRALEMHQGFPPGMYASMYHDLRQGRRIELESLSGLVVREGARLGVPTPVHEIAYRMLHPFLDGTPKIPGA
jgi:2-dehydropantoate 2-reductase